MLSDGTELFKNHKTGTISRKPEIMGPLFLKGCFLSHVISHFSSSISLIFYLSLCTYLATKLALCGINCIQAESMVST